MRLAIGAAVVGSVCAAVCPAQDITIQQPVVQTFGVNTVVTVPDQGSVLLGSVNSAADSRSWNGFSPLGSSYGGRRSASSARATVYIHDLRAMDEALLSEGRAAAVSPANPLAANAYRQLLRQPATADRAALAGAARPAGAATVARAPFGRTGQPLATPSSGPAAASRSTNSGDIPAASRAAR